MTGSTLTRDLLHKIDAYWRAAEDLSTGCIYVSGPGHDDRAIVGTTYLEATLHRLPQAGDKGIYLKQQLKRTLIDREQCGEDLPELRNWKWSNPECIRKN